MGKWKIVTYAKVSGEKPVEDASWLYQEIRQDPKKRTCYGNEIHE